MTAPLLLLLLSVASLGAVFAVHHIEAEGGPLGEPYATRFFSPNGDGRRDEVVLRMNEREGSRLSVNVIDRNGRVVRHLERGRRAKGAISFNWDGRNDAHALAPDGLYTFHIRRLGDRRLYAPVRPSRLDTRPPRLITESCTDGEARRVTCSVVTEPFATLTVAIAGAPATAGSRTSTKLRRSAVQPRSGLVRWLMSMTVPPGIDLAQLELSSTDLARNVATAPAPSRAGRRRGVAS